MLAVSTKPLVIAEVTTEKMRQLVKKCDKPFRLRVVGIEFNLADRLLIDDLARLPQAT